VSSSNLDPFVAKLQTHARLSDEEVDALFSLQVSERVCDPGTFLFREGTPAEYCCVVLSGFTCRHKIAGNGNRQILAVHMKGDGVDLQNALLRLADHNIQALTRVTAAMIPAASVMRLIDRYPGIARAMWIETLMDSSIQREWMMNVGRRDARARIAHLLCELGYRQEMAGIAPRDFYWLPLTQEQLADATGLTSVHVNRVLGGLRSEGVLSARARQVQVPDWSRLAAIGDFRTTYLHSNGHTRVG
jgi:CRP-like cAMP-binding protein